MSRSSVGTRLLSGNKDSSKNLEINASFLGFFASNFQNFQIQPVGFHLIDKTGSDRTNFIDFHEK
jgi:hypothetical protein